MEARRKERILNVEVDVKGNFLYEDEDYTLHVTLLLPENFDLDDPFTLNKMEITLRR